MPPIVRGEQGLPAPAVAWITALQVRDDGIWGRIDWLAEGRQMVESKSVSLPLAGVHLPPPDGGDRLAEKRRIDQPAQSYPSTR